jgi:hypothetical protein
MSILGVRNLAALAALALLVHPAHSHATSYVDRPLEVRLARAERVVLVQVSAVEVEVEVEVEIEREGAPPRLFTRVTLQVEQSFKGEGPRTLTLRQLGGTHGGWSAQLPGAPTFEVGERAVLLLRCPRVDECVLAGLRDAKLKVVDSGERAQVLVPRVHSEALERLTLKDVRDLLAKAVAR